MKQVFIGGKYSPEMPGVLDVFETIVRVCGKFFKEIRSPLTVQKEKAEGVSTKERLLRMEKAIASADLAIFEITNPSHGAGVEMEKARQLGKAILLIKKEGAPVSEVLTLVSDNLITYDDLDSLVCWLSFKIGEMS